MWGPGIHSLTWTFLLLKSTVAGQSLFCNHSVLSCRARWRSTRRSFTDFLSYRQRWGTWTVSNGRTIHLTKGSSMQEVSWVLIGDYVWKIWNYNILFYRRAPPKEPEDPGRCTRKWSAMMTTWCRWWATCQVEPLAKIRLWWRPRQCTNSCEPYVEH